MKKFLKATLAGALVSSTFLAGHASAQTVQGAVSQEGDLDVGVINEDKLLDSFVKQGLLSAGATDAEKQAFLRQYIDLKNAPDVESKDDSQIADQVKKADFAQQGKFKGFNYGLLNGNGKKLGQYKKQPDPVSETAYNGPVKTAKVMVLAVEFSDFPHNNILPGESDNYYTDYTLQHYEDMIFGPNGVKGPNGENFVSQKQFYLQQSGGTFTIDGKAYGWLKMPHTAAYYGADKASGGHDNVTPGGSKALVRDAYDAAKKAGIPLQDYDLEDPHDLDGDGNKNEPDGLVDHLMIIHSGMGQEAGGGVLGNNAIWSHRSAVLYDPDGLGKGLPGFYDYMEMPEDGAAGVFTHEFGHDLGLPDEYDTVYSGKGEPIGYWSIMSSGSWAGKIPGTEPSGFSPWAKAYFQSTMGGNWTAPTELKWEDVSTRGAQFLLDQANSPNGKNNTAIKVDLPKKPKADLAPKTGSYQFHGGRGDKIDNNMVTTLDLTGKTSAELSFDTYYRIEDQWDFAFVQVSADGGTTWKSLANGSTRSDVNPSSYPNIISSVPGFTGHSNGWENQKFDLSAYAGQKIQLRFRYATDSGYNEEGFYVDNVNVTADGQTVLSDGAENTPSAFTFNGFNRHDGNMYIDHYYLLEWRTHNGVDQGLADIRRGSSLMSYDPGLLVWYVDTEQTDNWVGIHPGHGFLGLVDSHLTKDMKWNTGVTASTSYQIADAAFGLNPTSNMHLVYPGQTLDLASQPGVSLFDDSHSYLNPFVPDAGRDLTSYGLKIRVNGQAANGTVGAIVVYK